nr:MAG TPA: 40S ribosomal protein S3 [Bacteriophage sp.]
MDKFYQVEKIDNWNVKIKVPAYQKGDFRFRNSDRVYKYYLKKYVLEEFDDYLYDRIENGNEFVFKIGFCPFLLNRYRDKMDEESIKVLEGEIKTGLPNYFIDGLREEQMEDLNTLLKSKRGLFQCYTSYGKTEVIANLVNFIVKNRKEKVLILTASDPSKHTVCNRLFEKFNIDLSEFDYGRLANLVNIKGFFKSKKYNPKSEYWGEVKWILADEVEYCVNNTIKDIYDSILSGVEYMYGFSATTDKKEAKPLKNESKTYSMEYMNTIGRNKDLMRYFSGTSVYRKPIEFNIDLIYVKSSLSFDGIKEDKNYEYSEMIYELFTDDSFCKLLERICMSQDLIYVPMLRLQVIDYWIENYFKREEYYVMTICSRGFTVYCNGEVVADGLKLNEASYLINEGVINLIVGTKSSYNSLDFPRLNKVVTLYSKTANVVLQTIGRAARSKSFEVHNISTYKYVPIYTNDSKKRIKLIKDYYKNSNIREIERDERYFEKDSSPIIHASSS